MLEKPTLRVHTLGRLTVEFYGEASITFVSQKAPVLLVYLLTHPREHSRDVLAEMFWSDTTSEQALKNLRTVLSNLQKLLGDYLDVTRQTLAITQLDSIWLDVKTFESQLDAISTKQKRPYSPSKLIAELQQALGIYQGDFLIGVKTSNAPQLDTWIMLEQERIRGRAAKAMLQVVNVALASGHYQQGIEYGRKLLAIEPLWEEAHRALMTLLLKNGNRTAALQQYDACVTLLESELGIEPEDETQALYRDIKTGRLKVPDRPHQRPNNLQKPTTPYIETPTVIQQISNLLDNPSCRLLTIMGQGGMGKTRLAQHIGMQRLEDYTDGVFFVSLASLTIPELLPVAILNALGSDHQDTRQSPFDTLLSLLRRKHVLLILDNFDHLLDKAEMLTNLLGHAPHVQILLTSREQLHLQGEHVFYLRALAYADSKIGQASFEAVDLFVQMAKLVQVDFNAQLHQDAIHHICKLVDGLPLAIVIAAAWVQFFPPDTIADRIRESLEFLTVERRDLPEHHRGIMALLRMTWADLSEHERTIMMKISVFPGDFDEVAAKVIGTATLEELKLLVSKSLLQADGQGRYFLHELLRRFALEQSERAGLADDIRRAHRDYYQVWLCEQAEQNLPIHTLYRNIDHEYHNITFFDWLQGEDFHHVILDHAPILTDYWIMRGYSLAEGVRLLTEALPFADTSHRKAHALYRAGQLLARMQQYNESEPLLEQGLTCSRDIGDVLLEAKILNELYRVLGAQGDYANARLNLLEMVEVVEQDHEGDEAQFQQILSMAYSNLGIVHMQMDDPLEAENYTRKALHLKDEMTDPVGTALCHNTLGVIALKREGFDVAEEQFREALRIALDVGHTRHQTIYSGNLAEVLHKQGQYEQAYRMYYDTLQIAYQIDNHKTCLNVLEQLTDIALDMEQTERAVQLLSAANRLRQETALAVEPRQQKEVTRREARLEEMLASDEFLVQLMPEEAMTLKEAVVYVKGGLTKWRKT